MPFIDQLVERLQRHPKRVVFPRGSDTRILEVAHRFASQKLGIPILVGNRVRIEENAKKLGIELDRIRIIEPTESSDWDNFMQKFRRLKRFQKMSERDVADFLKNPNYFATMMLATSQADAIVSGATSTASSALRPLLQIIPRHSDTKEITSLNILDLGNSDETVPSRTLFLSDCAVIPEPTSQQLCNIAVNTAALSYHLTNVVPRVAMLSYTSKSNSSSNLTVMKVKAATKLARQKAKNLNIPMEIDGELQVDAALVPAVARMKNIETGIVGKANVLIFPDLHAANIALKLVQVLTQTSNYGPILTGLTKPAAEISRGSNTNDIFGTAITVASQAIAHNLLYPTDNRETTEYISVL